MKTAESDNQKQQGATSEPAHVSSPSASTSTLVAPETTASVEGLQLLVQARLSVSSPNDPFEHEAESMADEFVKSIHGRTVSAPSSSAGSIARSVPDSGLVEGGGGGLATTDDTASAIMSARSGGQSLSGDVRARFEGFFGADLGGVKIHNDGTSDNLCRSINAEAFTTGNDVFFTSRNFKPGSSSGDHLLAHELTHVVQQGNAPALSRRALPDIQRLDDPKADSNDKKVADAGQAVGLGKIGTSIYGGVKGEQVEKPSLQTQDVKDSSISGESVGLVAAVTSLMSSMIRLVQEWPEESASSARDQLIGAVKSAVTICQNSTSIAATAGATVAAGAIPGVGLAYSTIDLALQSIKIHETRIAKSEADAKKAEIEKIPEATRTIGDRKLYASLTNLSASAKSEYIRSIFRLTSDLISIGGQITLLVTGPTGVGAVAGGALIAVGAIGQGLVALQNKIAQWTSAGAITASREEVVKAKEALAAHQAIEAGDRDENYDKNTKELTDRVDDLTVDNIGIDAYAAGAELIKYSAGLINDKEEFDAEAMSLVGRFGINEAWMLRYVKAGKDAQPDLLEKGAKIICEFVGESPNARGLIADLKSAALAVWEGIKFVAEGTWWVICYGAKVIARVAVAGYEDVLLPMWNAAMATPGLVWRFLVAAKDVIGDAASAVGGAAVKTYEAVKKKIKGEDPQHFVNEGDLVVRTSIEVTPIIKSYFEEKAARGTDVKPGTVTDLLKTPYKKFLATVKATPDDGSIPFAGADVQMSLVDNTVKTLICQHAPERVNKASVKCAMGKVDFTYNGSEKAKTKGFFGSLFGREKI